MRSKLAALATFSFVLGVLLPGAGGCRAKAQDIDALRQQLNRFEQLVNAGKMAEAERQAQQVLAVAEIVCRDKPALLADFCDMMGQLYVVQKRYDLAEPMYSRSLALNEKALGHWHKKIADTVHALGNSLYYQAKYAESAARYRQALEIRQRVLGPDHLDTAFTWRELAWSFEKANELENAAKCFTQALAIRERRLGKQAELVADTLNELANVRYFQRRYDAALPLYERALSIRRKLFGEESEVVANTLIDKADCLAQQYRLAEAESLYRRAVEIDTKVLGAESTTTAMALRSLGSALINLGRYDEADRLFKKALAIEEPAYGDADLRIARSLDAMARIRQYQGRYAEAEPLYHRSLSVREKLQPPDELSVAVGCNNLATLYDEEGRYSEAEPLFRRALALREKLLADDDPVVAESLNNLGALLRRQGRSREAEPYYRRALAIREKRLPPTDPELATSLTNLANLYTSLNQYDQAEPLYLRALAMLKQAYGDDHGEVARCESVLADLYWYRNRRAEAERLYESSLRKMEAQRGPNHPDLARYLYDLAWCRFYSDKAEEAQALLDRAIDIDRQSPISPLTAIHVYYLRARLNRQLGRKAEGTRDLERAMGIAERLRGASSGAELERAEFFAGFAGAFERMVAWQVEDGDIEKALEAIERSRARSLLDEIGLLGADLEAGRPAVEEEQLRQRATQLRSRLAALETRLQQTLAGDASPQKEAERQRLQQEINQCREELYGHYRDARASSAVYQNLVNQNLQMPSLAEIQRQLLGDKSLLLVYLIGAENGYVLTLTAADAQLHALAVGEGEAAALGCDAGPFTQSLMETLLLNESGLMKQLSSPRPPRELSTRLAALWRILIPQQTREAILAGSFGRLHVVPNGALSFLPFEALVTSAPGEAKYLLDTGPPIYYAPSVTVLDSLRIRPKATVPAQREPVLSVGDPQYTPVASQNAAEQSRSVLLRSHLTPLPYSGLESRWVRDVFRRAGMSTLVLSKQSATELNVRESIANRRIVHLACHGFADQAFGNVFGALALAPGPDAQTDPRDDGFLNLAEIYDLGLRGCELAILSACETNYGPQQQGEGVWTLSRGFLVAGARRVVASNWVVDDEAAASLVSYFCGALAAAEQQQQPDPYGAALQAAKRWIRGQKKWEAPYYWASMVMVGPK